MPLLFLFLLFPFVTANATSGVITGISVNPELLPKVKWSGDLRYSLLSSKEKAEDARYYQQLRLRVGFDADVNESLKTKVRLATGTSATSTNQTLGDPSDPGMPRRSFGIDRAYMDWTANKTTSVWLGRTANPFWRPENVQILYDNDLAFEGSVLRWRNKWSDSEAFSNLGGFIISENYAEGEDLVDIALIGMDLGWLKKGTDWRWTSRIGHHHYLNVKDRTISRLARGAKIDSTSPSVPRYKGNTVYAEDPSLPAADRVYRFKNDYALFQAGTEFAYNFGSVEGLFFFEGIRNTAISRMRDAFQTGLKIEWKWFSWTEAYLRKEPDSVLGQFSYFGSDQEGFRHVMTFRLDKNVKLWLTRFDLDRHYAESKSKYEITFLELVAAF